MLKLEVDHQNLEAFNFMLFCRFLHTLPALHQSTYPLYRLQQLVVIKAKSPDLLRVQILEMQYKTSEHNSIISTVMLQLAGTRCCFRLSQIIKVISENKVLNILPH